MILFQVQYLETLTGILIPHLWSDIWINSKQNELLMVQMMKLKVSDWKQGFCVGSLAVMNVNMFL